MFHQSSLMILVCPLIDILIVLLQHLTILVNCRPFRFSTRTDLGCVLSAEQTDLRGHIFLLMILLKEEMPTRYSWMGDFLLCLFDVHLVFMSNNFSCSYSDSDDISTNCTKISFCSGSQCLQSYLKKEMQYYPFVGEEKLY